MAEINVAQWPGLTDTQKDFINYVAARADTDIPDTDIIVGTYEVDDTSPELLTKYVLFRLYMPDGELYEAGIMHLIPDRSRLAYTFFQVAGTAGEEDTEPTFLIEIGEGNIDTCYESDEQVQLRLRKLEKLEQSGMLRRIITDPDDFSGSLFD